MAVSSVASFVEALQHCRLLEPAQLEELGRLRARIADPRALAKELMQRGWVTPYQVNQILQGRAQDLVLGSYVLLERLGEGGMGQVFKARHQKMGRVVALKLIRKDRMANPNVVRRFEQEIRAAAQLGHPNIVTAHDADQVGGTHFFAMEYIDGIDLARLVQQGGPLPVEQACAYIRQTALGLQHAHERGMVHRDIKPSNLLVASKEGVVKILDMGLARMLEDDHKTMPLTETDAVIGTPDYGSPEQARQSHQVDIRGDLYSLGCTFYFLLTGGAPFPDGTVGEKLVKHQLDEPVPVEQRRPEVPAGVGAIVRKLMAKRPEDRFQTPADLAAALEAGLKTGQWPAANGSIRAGRPIAAMAGPLASRGAVLAGRVRTGVWRMAVLLYQRFADLMRRSHWKGLRGVCAGLAALTLVLLILWISSIGRSPLDRLSPRSVSADDKLNSGNPDGLVAVLGDQRFRHWDKAKSLAWSPDGKALASGGDDQAIRLWDPATGVQQKAVSAGGQVGWVYFAQGGKKLITTDAFGNLKLFDAATGKEVQAPAERPIAWSGDQIILVPRGGAQVKLWNMATGQERSAFTGHTKFVYCAAVTSDGQLSASAGDDPAIAVWETATDKPVHSLKGHTTSVYRLQFAAGGKHLLSWDRDAMLKVWDLANEKELASYPQQGVWALSGDGKTLVTRGQDLNTRLLDVPSGRERAVLRHDNAAVGLVAFSADGQLVATANANFGDSLKFWDAATGAARPSPPANAAGLINGLAFSPDGQTLATASVEGFIKLWDSATGAERTLPASRPDWYTGARFSKDGQTLALTLRNFAVQLWDLPAGRERAVLKGHQQRLSAVVFSPDQLTMATGSDDGTVKIWDMASGNLLSTLKHGRYAITSAAFSDDGQTLISCEWESTRTWHPTTGQLKATLPANKSGAASAAITRDGRSAASGNQDGSVVLWDLTAGKERLTLTGLKGAAQVTYSPDGRVLAGRGSADNAIKLWDAASGKELGAVPPCSTWAWSPDGRSLATATGEDGQVRLWDSSNGQVKASLEGNAKQVVSVAFSNDGELVASAASDGRVIVWEPASRQRKLCEWRLPGQVVRAIIAPDGRHVAAVNGNGTVYILRLPPRTGK